MRSKIGKPEPYCKAFHRPGSYLCLMRFAVTDIETTGSYASACSIIEIGICIVENGKVTEEFHTLLDPGRPLPHFITALTGITDDMTGKAPSFHQVADELTDYFKDTVFVAHNVNFDFSFIKAEFEALGMSFNPPRLCTVKLARKAFPGHRSYSLGNITRTLNIGNEAPHRALGDARATAVLFSRCLDILDESIWKKMMGRNTSEAFLPQHIDRNAYDRLPERTGVYYFLDHAGKPIYIGKAKNIKKRVRSHFGGDLSSQKLQGFIRDIHSIDFRETAQELIALLWEDAEIRKYWPQHNRAQKNRVKRYNVIRYTDQLGYVRLAVREGGQILDAIMSFTSAYQARSWIIEFSERFHIDLRLMNIDTGLNKEQLPPSGEHNTLLEEALNTVNTEKKTVVLTHQAVAKGEYVFVLVEKGMFKGFGNIPYDHSVSSLEDLLPFLETLPLTEVNQSIALSYLEHPRGWKIIELSQEYPVSAFS